MIQIVPVAGIPEVTAGADLPRLISASLRAGGVALDDGDIVVVTSKIVSKALGLQADSSDRANLVLQESSAVVSERMTPTAPTRIVASLAGPVMAGAGIDASNAGDDALLLLPRDPDAEAETLRAALCKEWSCSVGVLLSDTSGRPWRAGVTDFALGIAGVAAVEDLRGHPDSLGRDLAVTVRNLADEICAAADLAKGKLNRVPVAIVRGLADLVGSTPLSARELVRTGPTDWFGLGRAEAVRAALGVLPGSDLAMQVGIESVLPESVEDRASRALSVALVSEGDDAISVSLSTGERGCFAEAGAGDCVIRLQAEDPVILGRVWARAEVALHGERLVCRAERTAAHEVTLVVSAAGVSES
ncbi:coenzyme F420-0:L-glutamate ligase [Rudaeicoccus suwonensis]|uniref:Coenzyme F420-0:L-glutamate ligase/coenzyme F420-1:gamma-L-glutamate ligase n=1 Tax=Rudaeicoccus suwonensis TaxID=657409 RepID=A0A561E921_9MICO|nr:coenzyme F420-0:L-glutamate ligase [Rudaeicoccus suwonensis]TWE12128.1 coenzyme F420-0:L-glutamate ligase/coenzyme F420-1:gamma-L-glutamate ligase [Rudaeicoccus suwonensis]